ncbi:MAG: hypothetical protein ACI4EV_02115 [Lachnospiraceae bacterium]
MKYPCLISAAFCKTPVEVIIEQEGTNEYGEPLPQIKWEGKCNYQDKARTIFTQQKKEVIITGTALIIGDIAPELESISLGTVTVYDKKRKIAQGTKARNPDGTVNYTMLELE